MKIFRVNHHDLAPRVPGAQKEANTQEDQQPVSVASVSEASAVVCLLFRLQSSVFCEFLINNFEEMEIAGEEFKITKENRILHEHPFNSNIDDNNGVVSPRKSERLPSTSRGVTKRTSNSRLVIQASSSSNKITQRILKGDERDENSVISRLHFLNQFYEGDRVEDYISEKSPGRIFRTAERELGQFERID